MKIIHISDTHQQHKQIKWGFEPKDFDLIICSGDVTHTGQKHELESFFNWFKKIPTIYKIFIYGNHDKCGDPKFYGSGVPGDNKKTEFGQGEWVQEIIDDYVSNPLNFYLENSSCQIEGINFWGSPITPWFHGDWWAFNKHRGYEINEIWNQIPEDTDVLITHGPPMGHGDYVIQDQVYVGCEALRYRIKEIKPLLHLFGHIHCSYGISYDESTIYSNGALCNDYNELQNKPLLFEINKEEKTVILL